MGGEVVGEHGAVAHAGNHRLLVVYAQVAFYLLHQSIHKPQIIIAGGPRALIAKPKCLATVVAETGISALAELRILIPLWHVPGRPAVLGLIIHALRPH